jgi:hypothetical protein
MLFKRTTPITALDLDSSDIPDASPSSKGGVTLGVDVLQSRVGPVAARALSDVKNFADWLGITGARGYVGEVGWPNTTDNAQWQEVGEAIYQFCDAADLWASYWATWPSTSYNLRAYDRTASDQPLSSTLAPATVIERHLSTPRYKRGVNVAGAEFGYQDAGFSNADVGSNSYETTGSYAYLASRGIELVRLPFRWERIQPTLGAALNSTELTTLTAAVNAAGAAGLKVILSVHNMASYYTSGHVSNFLGGAVVTQAHFVDLWTRLSTAFKANSAVIGYGLMNEPSNMPSLDPIYTERAALQEFDADITGWPTANGGAWSSQQGGSAAYTLPNSNSTFGENDTSLRDRSANGLAFWMDVYLPADAAGNWDVALEAQASDFSVIRTGGFVRLTKGATTRLVVEVTPAQAGSMRRIQLNVAANAGTQWH